MRPGQTTVVSRAGSRAEHVAPGCCLLAWQRNGRDRETLLSITLRNYNTPAQLDDKSNLLENMFCLIDKSDLKKKNNKYWKYFLELFWIKQSEVGHNTVITHEHISSGFSWLSYILFFLMFFFLNVHICSKKKNHTFLRNLECFSIFFLLASRTYILMLVARLSYGFIEYIHSKYFTTKKKIFWSEIIEWILNKIFERSQQK